MVGLTDEKPPPPAEVTTPVKTAAPRPSASALSKVMDPVDRPPMMTSFTPRHGCTCAWSAKSTRILALHATSRVAGRELGRPFHPGNGIVCPTLNEVAHSRHEHRTTAVRCWRMMKSLRVLA